MESFSGKYWETLKSLQLPYHLYMVSKPGCSDELVSVVHMEKRKRKNGAKVDQVYYILDDGRMIHASFFRKLTESEINSLKRDLIISNLLDK